MRLVCLLSLAILAASSAARAEPTVAERAQAFFARGSELFLAGKYDDALSALRASYELLPSPNSLLVIGRCLERKGRRVEAAETFRAAEQDADRRTAAGEKRYEATAQAARSEGAAVRAKLATVRVRAVAAPAGTALEHAGQRVPLVCLPPPEGGRAGEGGCRQGVVLLVEPGELRLRVHEPGAPPHEHRLIVGAGPSSVELGSVTGRGPDEPPPPSEGRAWAVPVAIASGALGAVGLGLFAGFGSSAQSIRDELEETCAPSCGAAQQEQRDTGERNATIANVSLVVGIAGAVGAATFATVSLGDEESARLRFGPGTVGATF